VLDEDNGTTITLRQPASAGAVWPRANVQAVEPQAWSLMPEGLEQGLTPQMMADLLEYVMSALR